MNADPGDGCDADCQLEEGFTCDDASPTTCAANCGDGRVVGGEACDDANLLNRDGCDDDCAQEPGFACDGASPTTCAAVCGDGLIVRDERCDDGNVDTNDGCDEDCAPEAGFDCAEGAPTVCAAICGDGLVVGQEGCDVGDAPGEGCDPTCQVEAGYACDGAPSQCATVCGDGILTGAEGCDDGNTDDLDGCDPDCVLAAGEGCADPLGAYQREEGDVPTWVIPEGSVTEIDGAFDCDANTLGPDAVIAYEKTSDTVANGGQLLRVTATTDSTSTSNYLNLEVVYGACDDGALQKCLWYKHDWDAILDGPPGTYFIFVGKNSPATSVPFPETLVTIEEVDPTSEVVEGEGCFAPYTTDSAIYAPPANIDEPHTWTIPATLNSFDMGVTWGEPGSISCDNTAPYGDIHGVDAVIAFDKAFDASVLLVEVQNLADPLSASALNVEVLSTCDPTDPARISRSCRADADSHVLTAPSPAGPVYVWISTEATGQEFGGAEVQITELALGVGESWPTAEPLAGSATLTPSSTLRLDPPTCFPADANVHWYRYTLAQDVLALDTNLSGNVGIYDAGGQQLACGDATHQTLGALSEPGATLYIGVPTGSTFELSLRDVAYTGVRPERATDLNVTWPASVGIRYGMAVLGDELHITGTFNLLSVSLTDNTTTLHDSAEGITTTHLAYSIAAANGALFSADTVTSTLDNRLFRLFDGATWGPTAWDLTPSYPASQPIYAIAAHNDTLFRATRRTSTNATFYTNTTHAPNTSTLLGTSDRVWYVVGIAVDDRYIYVASNGFAGEGLYRLERGNLNNAAHIAAFDTAGSFNALALDAPNSPGILYARSSQGDLYAVLNPASVNPIPIGALFTLGISGDQSMTVDHATGYLYLLERESDGAGRLIRLE